MSAIVAEADSDDLEALFDSIVKDSFAPAPAAAPKAEAATEADTAANTEANTEEQMPEDAPGDVMGRIGRLTRTLHDALRELGYDRVLEKTAASIPDARDRLDYVIKMTEQAAVRALNAIETAQPIQERLGDEAERLSANWEKLFNKQLSVGEFKTLVASTRHFLSQAPKQTRATNDQLLEIMMAQDFQDLTGQVIKKITKLAQDMEQQLVHLLVDLVPADVRNEIDTGLLNGPVVNAAKGPEVVTNQNQVDDLLASLGF
ncbi:MAG: protein phosphatase CheZ [Burkholderiales bacterium]|nr:protein phosphatase CheZ [Burkholderiales bacterium]